MACFGQPPHVERAASAQASHVAQGSVTVDQAPEGGLHCGPDRVRAGSRAGSAEEFVVDLDESLGHEGSIYIKVC